MQIHGLKSFKNLTVSISLLLEQKTKIGLSLGWFFEGGFSWFAK